MLEVSVAEANGLRSASEASGKQTMSGGGDVSVPICSTCGSGFWFVSSVVPEER